MEIVLGDVAGFPLYPYRKVVLVDVRAEVAELACEGESTENFVLHEDLVASLRQKYPELPKHAEFAAGWLRQSGDEAAIHILGFRGGFRKNDCDRIGGALRDWCESAGVRRLVIADHSQRGAANWDLPS
jgi:hypothetical protein